MDKVDNSQMTQLRDRMITNVQNKFGEAIEGMAKKGLKLVNGLSNKTLADINDAIRYLPEEM